MTSSEVEKYVKPVRIIHWAHSVAFVLLFITGLIAFIPVLGSLAGASWTHLVHRIGAVIFILAPMLYLVIKPRATLRGLKLAFTWGKADADWLKKAPGYFFTGSTAGMPPQGFLNTGQKFWWLLTIVFGICLGGSGVIMMSAKNTAAPGLLQFMVSLHDVSFVVTGCMFLLHLYLAIFSPASGEALKAITGGKISAAYARSHHGRWYTETAVRKPESRETPLDKPSCS